MVQDKFHIRKYPGEAADKVRRFEHQEPMVEGDETFKGTQLWLITHNSIRNRAGILPVPLVH